MVSPISVWALTPASRKDFDHTGKRRAGAFAQLLQAFDFATEFRRQLLRAHSAICHQHVEAAIGVTEHPFQGRGLASDGGHGTLQRTALFAECAFERRAVVLQALEQIHHGGAMPFMAAEDKFGAGHGGVGHGLDAFGLAIEFDDHRMRGFSGRVGGRTEIRDLGVQRKPRRLECAFRRFDVGFELRRPSGDKFARACGGVA